MTKPKGKSQRRAMTKIYQSPLWHCVANPSQTMRLYKDGVASIDYLTTDKLRQAADFTYL